MEPIQLLKNRIQSIGSTRQITQSMRLVSTSKVQKARSRMNENRRFMREARSLVLSVSTGIKGSGHPYVKAREVKKSAVIFISSDRGLCGGYATNVGKEAVSTMKAIGDCKVITVGAKARDYCRRRRVGEVAHTLTGASENPFFEDAKDIADMALAWYNAGEVDQIYLVYTQFESMLVQNPHSVRLLPLEPEEESEESGPISLMRLEPGEETFLSLAVPFYLAAYVYGAMLESSACEQSARITSMDAAVKNADEMIAALSLAYNQARQGAITQEIIEIVGGANAVQ